MSIRRLAAGLSIGTAAVVIGVLFGPTLGWGQSDSPLPDTVTVSASGSVEIDPDMATVSFGIRTSASTAQAASDELSERTNAVLDALEEAGFTEEEVTVADISLFRDHDRDGNFVGYVGSVAIRVEVDDLDRVGEVIDLGVAAGADSIRGVSFGVKDRTEAIKQALREAMGFATAKANVLATEGGRTLGRALIIEEHGTRAPRSVPAPLAAPPPSGSGAGSGARPFPIRPPKLTATATISVTFQMN